MQTHREPHVVILGGGFGGLYCAKALRKLPVRVTVIDKYNFHLFQPLLYQVATASLSPANVAQPIRWILRGQANTEVWLAEATGIDLARRTVELEDGSVGFDYLVVATGARHSYFGHDEWEQFAPGLKSIDDATILRRRFLLAFESAERESNPEVRKCQLTFVIIGGGPTGVELAGAMAEIARQVVPKEFRAIDTKTARIVLLEGGPRILPNYPEELSDKAQRALEKLGVEVRTNALVTRIEDNAVYVGSEEIQAATSFWAAGVAASPLGADLGAPLDRAGRVMIHDDCSIPNHPNVFVIGDLAHKQQDGNMLPGVAQVAMQMGTHTARMIKADLRNGERAPFRYFDKGNMATIGRAAAVADIFGLRFGGFFAWLIWVFLHIAYLIGFRNRAVVMVQWAWAYLTFQRGARLITGENARVELSKGVSK